MMGCVLSHKPKNRLCVTSHKPEIKLCVTSHKLTMRYELFDTAIQIGSIACHFYSECSAQHGLLGTYLSDREIVP